MKILLVDDSPLYTACIRAQLEHYGHEVLTAESGEQAVRLHLDNPSLDLTITDLEMPGMNGLELVRELRKISPTVRIWLNTGINEMAFTILEPKVLKAGAEKVLLKKHILDELRRAGILPQ